MMTRAGRLELDHVHGHSNFEPKPPTSIRLLMAFKINMEIMDYNAGRSPGRT